MKHIKNIQKLFISSDILVVKNPTVNLDLMSLHSVSSILNESIISFTLFNSYSPHHPSSVNNSFFYSQRIEDKNKKHQKTMHPIPANKNTI